MINNTEPGSVEEDVKCDTKSTSAFIEGDNILIIDSEWSITVYKSPIVAEILMMHNVYHNNNIHRNSEQHQ